jgi:electron transport complex protein RnfC
MADSPIQMLETPWRVRLPIDSMATLVTAGDRVEAGCLVAESSNDARWYRCFHAPLLSTVSGNGHSTSGPSSNGPSTNSHSTNGPSNSSHGSARTLDLLVEENSTTQRQCDHHSPAELAPEEIANIARRAGLLGMGGGMFPTYVKLSPTTPIDWVIINGCESEPYLTCDHRVLVEHRDEVECGMRLAMQAVGATQGTMVDAEDNYLDGYESRLIAKVLDRQVPKGGRPSDVGVVVLNVQSARALHRAVCERRPLVDRVVTVDGNAIGRPGNYVVPLGTEIRHVLNVCGVDWDQMPTVIAGGPIMGSPIEPEAIVTAGIGGILALTTDEISKPSQDPCIRCGRCQEVCPMALPSSQLIRQPTDLLLECIECGMCQFTCPAQRPILQEIRKVKSHLRAVNEQDS